MLLLKHNAWYILEKIMLSTLNYMIGESILVGGIF